MKRMSLEQMLLPILPERLRPYAKSILLLIGNALAVAQFYFADNPKVAIAIMVATTLGVYAQPNEILPEQVEDLVESKVDDLLDGKPLG